MRIACLIIAVAVVTATAPLGAQSKATVRTPETFSANANVVGAGGASAAVLTIQVDRYSSDVDRATVENALTTGGYPAFLTALRGVPEVGHLEMATQKFSIRYARQTETSRGRSIVLVTDRPVFFVGGGVADPKPREGFEVAVIQFEVDSIGLGSGTMAAAARVRPGPAGGVLLDDYAEQPIKLVTVTRRIS